MLVGDHPEEKRHCHQVGSVLANAMRLKIEQGLPWEKTFSRSCVLRAVEFIDSLGHPLSPARGPSF